MASQSRDERAAQTDPEGFLPQAPLLSPMWAAHPLHTHDQPSPASDVLWQ